MSIPALVFFACALMAGQSALAQEQEPTQTENGYCGDPNVNNGEDVSYSYNPDNHTLTISGTGAMRNYEDINERPWCDYYKCITTIVIDNGVTSIGSTMSSHCSNLESVTISSSVTHIGSEAFYQCPNLTSVTFQGVSHLESIGESAFLFCEHLSSFTIPASVTTIDEFAFCCCSSLTIIEIPAGVADIGAGAFTGCEGISSFNIAQGNAHFMVNDGVLFNNDGTTLICYPAGKSDAAYTVPAGVRVIDDFAFSGNEYLTLVSFEDNSQLTTIGVESFEDLNKLESISIPNKVSGIGESAFWDCTSLETITFEDSSALDSIGEDAFDGTPWLDAQGEVVYIGKILHKVKDSYTGSLNIRDDITVIGNGAACYCEFLTAVTIPASVTTIGDEAFEECSGLETVTFTGNSHLTTIGNSAFDWSGITAINIPASVTDIGNFAFGYCEHLTTVVFDGVSHLTTLNEYVFEGCCNLSEITIPSSVTSIKECAFYECGDMATVTFDGESQLNYIGTEAFNSCYALSAIEIPSGVTHIAYGAFYGCYSMETVTFAANSHLTIIDEYAFNDCSGLLSITIPASVTTIGTSAFAGCNSLATVSFAENSRLSKIDENAFGCCAFSSIAIPASVDTIGEHAFDACSNLTTVSFDEHSPLTELAASVFSDCQNLENIVIPEGVTSIGLYAFYDCEELESIIIPSSVKEIGYGAFEDCLNLTAVYVLPSTSPSIDHSFDNINNSCHFYLHGEGYDNDYDWQNDVIAEFGHTTVYSLTLNAGITATGSAAFTAYGKSYYAENAAITISGGNSETPVGYQADSFTGYALNRVPIGGSTFDMPAKDVRISAVWTPIDWAGSGTENDPYMIAYPSQLDLLAERVNAHTDYTDTYFKLANDITYSYDGYEPTESNYTGIGTVYFDPYDQNGLPSFWGFNGTFDGNGKAISGVRMYVNGPGSMAPPAIFNILSNPGVVKNLTVRDTKISVEYGAGGIAGIVDGGTIENCTSYADLHVLPSNRMGLIGGIACESVYGIISNCTSYSTIKISDNANDCQLIGGIAGGIMESQIDNCYSYASINLGNYAIDCSKFGGITGMSVESTVTNCFSSASFNIGDYPQSCEQFGGLIGALDGGFVSSNIVVDAVIQDIDVNTGAIIGGIANEGSYIHNYYSNCNISGNTDNIGSNGGDIAANDGAVKATILLENEAAPASLADGEKVVFRREFKQGVSSTVCLPVAIDESLASAVGKFFTFAGVDMTDPDDWTVVMQEVAGNNMVDGDLQANTPYLFIPDADGPVLFIGEADGSSVTAGNATNGNWTFQGTYESIEWNAGNQDLGKVYGFAAQKYEAVNPGKFVMAGAGASIAPYRSYLMYNPVLSAPSRGGSRPQLSLPGSMRVVLLGSDGVETAVGKINTATGEISIDSWYDMSGRKLQGAPAKGGMYIHGGKTIMINE